MTNSSGVTCRITVSPNEQSAAVNAQVCRAVWCAMDWILGRRCWTAAASVWPLTVVALPLPACSTAQRIGSSAAAMRSALGVEEGTLSCTSTNHAPPHR